MPSAAKNKKQNPVIGSIASTDPSSDTTLRSTQGRKTRAQAALHPYTVYQNPRTGGFYVRFTDPATKKRVHRPLAKSGAGQTATKHRGEAERLAAALWQERLEKSSRVAAGIEPELEVGMAPLIKNYCDHVNRLDVQKGTRRSYIRHMRNWAKHTRLPKVSDVRHVNGPMLRLFAQQLSDATHQSRTTSFKRVPFTRGMVRAHIVTLGGFFTWVAKCHGVNLVNPVEVSCILEDFPRPCRGEDHFYSPEQVNALLNAADGWKHTARTLGNREILYLLAYTGARIGEILRLRAQSIDFAANTITFENLKRTRKEKAEQTRKSRTLTMWPRLRSVLQAYVQRHGLAGEAVLFPMFKPARNGRRPVARRRTAGPYEWLQTLCARTGAPYRDGLHVWRHTYVSIRGRMQVRQEVLGSPGVYVVRKVTLEDIQDEVGHVEGSGVTARVYKHASLRLPNVAIFELDWKAIVQELERHRASVQERFENRYHVDDAAHMVPLASAGVIDRIPQPGTYR